MGLKLTINKLSFAYNDFPVLKEIEISLDLGQVLSIVGPNGSGKSTLLKCINRILKPRKNTVLIDGKDANTFDIKELSKIMGYVPQSSTSTFPFTVFDVVLMGRKPYVNWNLSDRDSEIVCEILDFLGISELAMRHFNELSGGEQQKVIIARALAQQPQILLLDEPTSSLDIKHQLDILNMLRSLTQSGERSVIVTMHDLNSASRFSDKMVMLKQGCIFASGTPESVLTEANITTVYGVDCKVTDSILGKPQVTPIISENGGGKIFRMSSEMAAKCLTENKR